jgi:hypothetical protein
MSDEQYRVEQVRTLVYESKITLQTGLLRYLKMK